MDRDTCDSNTKDCGGFFFFAALLDDLRDCMMARCVGVGAVCCKDKDISNDGNNDEEGVANRACRFGGGEDEDELQPLVTNCHRRVQFRAIIDTFLSVY